MEKLNQKPDESGYSITENVITSLYQALDGGLGRFRRDEIDGAARSVTLQWSGSKKRYEEVLKFFDDNIGRNCPQFLVDLQIAKSEYEEYTANVIPESIKRGLSKAAGYYVSANFDVLPRDDELENWPGHIIMGMHFDGNYIDVTGITFSPFNSGVITETVKKFGKASYFDSPAAQGRIVSENLGDFNLGSNDFQIEGFINLNSISINASTIISLQALVGSGGLAGAGGNNRQFQAVITGGSAGKLEVYYSKEDGVGQTMVEVMAKQIQLNRQVHFAIVQNKDSFRAYLDGFKVCEDTTHRLYNASNFTNQGYIIGAAYAGGGYPGLYTNFLDGYLDDLSISRKVTYFGDKISVPEAPFVNGTDFE